MHAKIQRPICAAIATALVLAPCPGSAVIPVLLAHQILKQIVEGELRSHMASMFAGAGCKGSALASLIGSAGALPGVGGGGLGAAGALSGGGLATLAAAAPGKGPGALLSKLALPHLGQLFARGAASKAPGSGMPNVPAVPLPQGAAESAGAAARGELSGSSSDSEQSAHRAAEAVERATAQTEGPGGKPASGSQQPGAGAGQALGLGLSPMMAFASPEMVGRMQGAAIAANPQLSQAMASIQQASAHPLSRAESLKVLEELNGMGLLDKKEMTEAEECLAVGGATVERTLGTTTAFMSVAVLPTLHQAKAQFASLTPEEQSHLADEVAEQLRQVTPEQRQRFTDAFGAALFPPAVVQQARAKAGLP